jgi:hypothetical protein
MVIPPTTPGGPTTVVLSFNPIRPRPNLFVRLVVPSAGITDRAGNRLDGAFNGTFPSGIGLAPLADFVQTIPVRRR